MCLSVDAAISRTRAASSLSVFSCCDSGWRGGDSRGGSVTAASFGEKMLVMKPSIGRVVHYVSYGTPNGEYPSECRAAIVTEIPGTHATRNGVLGPLVGLCVLNPTGQFFNREIQHDPGADAPPANDPRRPELCEGRYYAGGTWHWPEKV